LRTSFFTATLPRTNTFRNGRAGLEASLLKKIFFLVSRARQFSAAENHSGFFTGEKERVFRGFSQEKILKFLF
jgi:hypothetical protein